MALRTNGVRFRNILLVLIGLVFALDVHAYQELKLLASDGADSDYFGRSVDIYKDTIVVGSFQADNNGDDSGSVYVYTRNGSNWIETELPANAASGEGFGFSVAIYGDTLAVGAPGGNAVYVYTHNGSVWSLQQKLTKPGGAFGISVDIYKSTLIVGCDSEDTDGDGDGDGAAYIYTRSGNTWTSQKRLTFFDPSHPLQYSQHYGYSVAIEGNTVVVGAYRYTANSSLLYAGSAYVYRGSGSNWAIEGNLGALAGADLEASDFFGRSVDIHNDTILVGANRDGGSVSVGAAYVFERNSVTWSKQQKIFASNAGSGGKFFGCSVSLLSDRAIIGAYEDVIGSIAPGATHVFTRNGSTWTEDGSFLTAGDAAMGDRFGGSVAQSESFVIVGSYRDDNENGGDAGAVYVYGCETSFKATNEFQVNTFTDDDQTHPSIAFDPNGSFVVAWDSYWQDSTQRSIYAQKYDTYGRRIGDEFRVNEVFTGMQTQSDIVFLPDGRFVVIWTAYDSAGRDGVNDGLYARQFDPNCNPVTDDILVSVSDESKKYPRLALQGNRIMVVWDNWVVDTSLPANGLHHVKARLLDLALSPVTPEITVSENNTPSQIVKADGLGNFIVAWSTVYDRTICMKKYDVSGSQVGIEKILDSSGSYESFSISPDSSGNFWFVCTRGGLMNFDSTVFAQEYDPNATAVGSEIVVCDSYMYKRGIESCLLSNGNLLVTWYGQLEGDDYDIYCRVFDGNGIAVNSESVVNSNNGGTKWWARPAAGLNGRYAVAWSSTDQDGSEDGVYAAIGPKTYLGDFNLNRQMDIFDIRMVAEGWLSDEPVLDIAPDGGDGVINSLDFSVVAEQWSYE